MVDNKTDKQGKLKIQPFFVSMLFFALCFVYVLWRIDPKLIYQSQEPVFFFDMHFLIELLCKPGGLNDIFARFLSQFFYVSWMGALLLTGVLGLVAWNTKRFLQLLGVTRPPMFLHWIPAVFLLALHSDYTYPLVFTLGILWICVCTNIYIHFSPSNNILRLLFYILLHILLYFIIANQALIFSITITLYEILYRRKIIYPIAYILFAALLPYFAAKTMFIISIEDAYLQQLTFYESYHLSWLSWLLYAFFSLILISNALAVYAGIQKKGKVHPLALIFYNPSKRIQLVQGTLFFIFIFILVHSSFEKSRKEFLLIDYYSSVKEWDKLLDIVRQGRSGRSVVESQTYRALYHSGRLSDELFKYTRHFSGDGLFMHASTLVLFPRQHSDIFFDLGILNESEHWAYEAMASNGETAWNLQRLVLVNTLEGNKDVAERYLEKLAKTVWHRAWAKEYQKVLSDEKDLLTFPQFHYLKSAMPKSDFLISSIEPKLCLEELLQTPDNRMAFEYYMANCLLAGDISNFIKQVHRLNDFGYSRIPRHFEEAILVYIQLTGRKNVGLSGINISDATIRRFIDFNQILNTFNKNADQAFHQLEKYKDTYWFYALYRYRLKG